MLCWQPLKQLPLHIKWVIALSIWSSIWRGRCAVFTKCQQHTSQTAVRRLEIRFQGRCNIFYSIIQQYLIISEAVCNLQLCIVSLGNLEEHCVCVKRCSGLEHFNNSIWQRPQEKDKLRTPRTMSGSFSVYGSYHIGCFCKTTLPVMTGWFGTDLGFMWWRLGENPEFTFYIWRHRLIKYGAIFLRVVWKFKYCMTKKKTAFCECKG